MLYQLTQQAQTNGSIVLHFSLGKVSEDGTLYLKITYGLYCRHPMALIKNQVIPITTQLNSPFRLKISCVISCDFDVKKTGKVQTLS